MFDLNAPAVLTLGGVDFVVTDHDNTVATGLVIATVRDGIADQWFELTINSGGTAAWRVAGELSAAVTLTAAG